MRRLVHEMMVPQTSTAMVPGLLCENGHPLMAVYRDRMLGSIGYGVLCRSHSELSLCIRHRYCCVGNAGKRGLLQRRRSGSFNSPSLTIRHCHSAEVDPGAVSFSIKESVF